MIMGIAFLLTIAVSLFIGYKYGQQRARSAASVDVTEGKTIVVDKTPVDTSKEDELEDRFGDLK